MSVQPFVLIVILNWNDAEETVQAVQSLSTIRYDNWRALVVDNGSTDGSLERLLPLASENLEVVGVPENRGYTGGCNLGLHRGLEVGADYVWLLNNDAVAETETLASLVQIAESDPGIGLLSPLITSLHDPDQIIIAGALFDRASRQHGDTHSIAIAKEWQEKYPQGFIVHGTAMLVPARVIRAMGVLDDSLFAYYEDVEYSVRSIDHGFRNVVDWNTRVPHENKNYNRRPSEIRPHYWYYMARNEIRLWRQYLGWRSLQVNWWATSRFLIRRNLISDAVARNAILTGLWHGWTGRKGPYNAAVGAPVFVRYLLDLYSRRPSLRKGLPTG